MINPDNTVNTSKSVSKSSSTERTEKPEGLENEKFKEIYGVFERKKTKEELAQEWEEVREETENGHLAEAPAKKPKPALPDKPVSLFELASKSEKEVEADAVKHLVRDTTLGEEIPQSKKASQPQERPAPKKTSSLFDLASTRKPDADTSDASPLTKAQTKEPSTQYLQESPDLSHINLLAQSSVVVKTESTEKAAPEVPKVEALRLQKIIDEIVEHVYQLEKDGETSTIITINNEKSPLNGAAIKISEFDSSKGQLNITIDNLKPEVKVLIERHAEQLLHALELKGYQVQQFVATTQLETQRLQIATEQQNSSGRQRDEEKEQQQKKRQNDEQEEQ